jgi:hypothetical protein
MMKNTTYRIALCALCVSVLTLGLATGCSKKHENFPDPLGVSAPQKVTNLSVSDGGGTFVYIVDWDITDPSTVAYYRVYWSIDGQQFALGADTVMTTSATFTAPLPVASFGVTVVSDEFVEGAMVTADTP